MIAAVLLTLTLAACSGSSDPLAGSGEGAAYDAEGSVTTEEGSFVEYPDGLVVRVARVEHADRGLSSDLAPDEELVKVTLELENTGDTAIPLERGMRRLEVLYGENRMPADSEPGYIGNGVDTSTQVNSEDPTQVAPGNTVEVFETAQVPESEMVQLAVQLRIDSGTRTSYTFTDVETLLQ